MSGKVKQELEYRGFLLRERVIESASSAGPLNHTTWEIMGAKDDIKPAAKAVGMDEAKAKIDEILRERGNGLGNQIRTLPPDVMGNFSFVPTGWIWYVKRNQRTDQLSPVRASGINESPSCWKRGLFSDHPLARMVV